MCKDYMVRIFGVSKTTTMKILLVKHLNLITKKFETIECEVVEFTGGKFDSALVLIDGKEKWKAGQNVIGYKGEPKLN